MITRAVTRIHLTFISANFFFLVEDGDAFSPTGCQNTISCVALLRAHFIRTINRWPRFCTGTACANRYCIPARRGITPQIGRFRQNRYRRKTPLSNARYPLLDVSLCVSFVRAYLVNSASVDPLLFRRWALPPCMFLRHAHIAGTDIVGLYWGLAPLIFAVDPAGCTPGHFTGVPLLLRA